MRSHPRPFLSAFSIARRMYADAGARVDVVDGDGVGDAPRGQKHTGGIHDKWGRPIGTRRFTPETLSAGSRKAMAAALSWYGVESLLRRVKARTTCTVSEEELSSRLSVMAGVSYRGQVWPLMHLFGFFFRCEGGMSSVAGERDVSCTWAGRNGFVNCSCQERTRLLRVMRRPEAEADDIVCTHGAAMVKTLRKLSRTLGINMRSLRAVVGNLHGRCRSRHRDVLDGDVSDDGDCERFVVGESVFSVAVTGHGDNVVAAPVRFTRKNTTCMLCDSARTAACAHVSLTRHFNRLAQAHNHNTSKAQEAGPEKEGNSPAPPAAAFAEPDIVQSISQKPIGMFNCHRATQADAEIGEVVAKGGTFRMAAPAVCPQCKAARGSEPDVGTDGVVLATAGPCVMHLEAYFCECGKLVSADGREHGVVAYTSCTAASAVLMRQWAFALVLSGITYAVSFEAWRRQYLDRRDAGKAKLCRIRGKMTVNKVFNAAVRLMTDDPPSWCFTCSACQDSDGRFRVVTADGIWLGFLRRLAAKLYASPCQPCKSVVEYVRAGSLCGSEAMRRSPRLALKQPAKTVVIKTNQLPSAEKALFFLCPAALPANRVAVGSTFEHAKMTALHKFLDRIWVLDQAAVELARAVVKRIRHVLSTEIGNSRPANRVASVVETAAHVRAWLDSNAAPAAGAQGGNGSGGSADDGESEGNTDGKSSTGAVSPPPPPPPPPPRRGRRGGHGADQRGAANIPRAAVRAGREAAVARRHNEESSVAEQTDPRCLRPDILGLGPDQFKPIVSLAVALATDSVVNAFKPRHVTALEGIADDLAAANAGRRMDVLLGAACSPASRAPPLPIGGAPVDPVRVLSAAKARVTHELRIVMACLLAMRFNEQVFEMLRQPVSELLRTVCATVKDCHVPKEGEGNERSAIEFGEEWLDPSLSPDELRARFQARFSGASDDPMVTGCFFPEMPQCRPGPFLAGESPELGMCEKHYQAVHKFFSPGTFTVCCACPNPKLVGFAVLEKREGPYALLNAIITRFALLPHFIVYDFGCGALRSAIGELPAFVAMVVIISDRFHIINHVCSDIFCSRSYAPLDGKNTVAHEQRNSPISDMMKTLRASGQDEYMRIMKLHTILHNVHAQARTTCTYPLPDDYNFRQFYFSRQACPCGCGQQETEPTLPSPPSTVPSTPTSAETDSSSSLSGASKT